MPLLTIAPPPNKGEDAPPAALRIVVDKPTDDALLGVTMTSNTLNQVLVRFLTDDSIIKDAGLLIGDQVMEVNGVGVGSATKCTDLLKATKAGRLELLVQRNPSPTQRAQPVLKIMLQKESKWSACDLLLESSKEGAMVKGARANACIGGDLQLGARLLQIAGQTVKSVAEAEKLFSQLDAGMIECILSQRGPRK